MVNTDDINLMNKVLLGEASKGEIELFNQKIKNDSELESDYIYLKDGLKQHRNLEQLFSLDVKEDWNKVLIGIKRDERINKRIGKKESKGIPLFDIIIRVAAVIVIFTGLVFGILKLIDDDSKKEFMVIKVPYGAKNTIELTDGTIVDLNSGSVLKVPIGFNKTGRTVELEGEAFFNVTKSKIPFIVNTSTVDIKVHGTKFNIKTYSEEKFVETTLFEGSLSVKKKNEGTKETNTLKLVPNQKLILDKKTNNMILLSLMETKNSVQEKQEEPESKINIEQLEQNNAVPVIQVSNKKEIESSIAWKEGLIFLNHETLEDLAIKLERIYDLKIEFASKELREYTISGTLRQFTIQQLLDGLKLMLPINYKIKDNIVIIYKKK